jgi:hypothetical protein
VLSGMSVQALELRYRNAIARNLRLLWLARRTRTLQYSCDRVFAEPQLSANQSVAQACLGQLQDLRSLGVRRSLSWLSTKPLATRLGGGDTGRR